MKSWKGVYIHLVYAIASSFDPDKLVLPLNVIYKKITQ
jgi:hypothetical protein